MSRKVIILIGFMGTGKSTVALALADKLGWRKVDMDSAIEADQNSSIPDLFTSRGEAYFREVETNVLIRTLQGPDQLIVSTGGGAVLAEKNRAIMMEAGLVVALTATEQAILSRVKNDPNRPLLKGNAVVAVPALLEARKHAYDFAHLKIDTTDKSVEGIVDIIVSHIK